LHTTAVTTAPSLLLKAARRLELLDVKLAREAYLEALSSAMYGGNVPAAREAAEAARAAQQAPQPLSAPDLLLDGLSLLQTESYGAAAPTLKRALAAFCSEGLTCGEALRWLWVAIPSAARLWDDESWDRLTGRYVQLARDSGALGMLPIALNQRVMVHLYEGDLGAAVSMLDEAVADHRGDTRAGSRRTADWGSQRSVGEA